MKCHFHPREDALLECTSCGKPICGACMRFDDDDRVVCPSCTLESAVDLAGDDVQADLARRRKQVERDERPPETSLERALAAVNGWYLVALLALFGLNAVVGYQLSRAGEPATFDPAAFKLVNDPAPEMTYVLAKVFAFARDHNGTYPENLRALTPAYLERPATVLGSDEPYNYARIDGPEGFVLSLPKAERYGYRKLYATAAGIVQVE